MKADDVILETLARARAVLDTGVDPKGLAWLLERADSDLKAKLLKLAGKGGPFTVAQAVVYRQHIAVATGYVQGRVRGLTDELATAAISPSIANTVDTLRNLEAAFAGIATAPLQLEQAARLAGLNTRVKSSLLARHAASADRYGTAMTMQFETVIGQGLLQGKTQHQMINELCGMRGPRGPRVSLAARENADGTVTRLKEADIPEGLFARKRYWAERIVRTEVAYASNAANLASIMDARAEMPDMGKKIMATFDPRTAMDSVAVHGQVRPPDGLFQDGKGRQYQHPPARPHDRETIIPWRQRWPETDLTRPVPTAEAADLVAAPAIAQGKPVAAAVRDAKESLAGLHAKQLTGRKVGAAVQAAQTSARSRQVAARQARTVERLAAEARASASLQAAHAAIDRGFASEMMEAERSVKQAVTALGKRDVRGRVLARTAALKAKRAVLKDKARKR